MLRSLTKRIFISTKKFSCVLFHERLDVIITNSEDKTMRVWDLYSKNSVDTFTKSDGRYWTLASHPTVNYVAAGHDTGFSVFTLQSERISSVLAPNQQDLFYVYKKQLFHKDCRNGRETLIKDIDHTPTGSSMCYQQPSAIYYNQFNNTANNVLIQFKDKEKIYHKYYLYTFDSNIARAKNECSSTFRYCLGAVFIAKDRLAILSNSKEVGLLDNSGNIKNLANLPLIDMIYPAHMGKLIMRSDTAAILYDTTTRKLINQIDYTDIQHMKRVVWSNKYTHVALLCKKTVYILNKNFNLLTTINEQFKVSSAVWNNDGVLNYTTKTHLKYGLVNGDQGIIKSLETPIYLIQASGNEIIAIDSEARFQKFSIDREEYLFKLAIRSRNAAKIEACLKNHTKLGNSLISYLCKKNYSAIALHMVDDLKARFSLAIDSGNLEVAFETCHDQLKDKESYSTLSEEALRQGNHQIMEIAYQKNRNYEKLSFLYLVTGNLPKLEKMMGIAQKRGDIMSRFQNALFLGDISERVRILAEAGLVHLAYLSAVNHGLQDMVQPLAQAIEDSIPSLKLPAKPVALVPPKPLVLHVQASPMTTINWPHKELNEEEILLAGAVDEDETQETAPQELELNIDSIDNEYQDKNAPKDFGFDKDIMSPLEEGNWGVDDIVDLPDIDELDQHSASQQISSLADSAPGRDPLVERARNSQLAGELATCGDFEGAASILRRQIGVRDAAAFTPVFNKLFKSSRVVISGLPFVNPVAIQMSEDGNKLQVMGSTSQLMNILRIGYKQTSDGKFTEALTSFREILLQIPLLVLQNPQEEQDIYTLINICYNYIVALRCEISRRQNQDNPKRSLELSAYMCCCVMEPAHRVLVLRNAMALAYKQQDFIYAAYFAKRILQIAETNPNVIKSDKLDNARKVYAACEQKGTNQHTIEFDQNWLYENDAVTKICAKSLTLLKGNQVKRDAYIKASYKSEYDGQVDDIAGVCVIGAECLGLKLY